MEGNFQGYNSVLSRASITKGIFICCAFRLGHYGTKFNECWVRWGKARKEEDTTSRFFANAWGVSDIQLLRDCQKRRNFSTDRVSRWPVNKKKPYDWNHKDGADICVPHHSGSLSVRWWPCWGSDIGRETWMRWRRGMEGWTSAMSSKNLCFYLLASLYILIGEINETLYLWREEKLTFSVHSIHSQFYISLVNFGMLQIIVIFFIGRGGILKTLPQELLWHYSFSHYNIFLLSRIRLPQMVANKHTWLLLSIWN